MRIGWNLLHARPEIGGGWNYIANLLAAVGREDRTNEYVAFVTDTSDALVPRQPNVRTIRTRLDSQFRPARVLYENTMLQALARRERLDCLHWFANVQGVVNAVPAAVTVYDLQPFMSFGQLPPVKRAVLRAQLRAAARGAAVLLPMSQSTAADLAGTLGADPARMTVIPPVLEPLFEPPAPEAVDACRRRYQLPETFWLYVAHMYPHKNHERLLRAYRDLRQQRPDAWPLVLRGDLRAGTPVPTLLRELSLDRDVMVLPALAREDLPALYGAASALVFPSLYEGAGIPVLEAQACGCPVIASDIAPLREFAGEAAVYFNPLDVAEMCCAMIRLADDAGARDELRALGYARARAFRALPVVADLLRGYERARSGPRGAAPASRSAH